MKKLRVFVLATLMVIIATVGGVTSVFARGDINIGVSPMRTSLVLNPGDEYRGSFTVSNPGFSEDDLYYHVDIKPFYVDENYDPVFDDSVDADKQLLKDWITITTGEKGVIAPNNNIVVEYEIKVPETAPAGGQYACLSATTDVEPGSTGGINIGEGLAINYVILAEITGDTVTSGEILDAGVQSFMLDSKIRAYSIVENTGNVHGLATYTMKVSPIFSDEIIYSSEGEEEHYVLPERKFYSELHWEDAPTMGIFDVAYVVEFQGLKSEVNGIVIICPWWAIFIVVVGVMLLVMRMISLKKLQKAAQQLGKNSSGKQQDGLDKA